MPHLSPPLGTVCQDCSAAAVSAARAPDVEMLRCGGRWSDSDILQLIVVVGGGIRKERYAMHCAKLLGLVTLSVLHDCSYK